jgi:rod shape-determining protein MreC
MSAQRRRAIALLALTSIILVTLDLQQSGSTSLVRSIFSTVFRPVEGVARIVTRPVGNVWNGITNYNEVVDENDLLREKIAQQEGAAVAAAASVRLAQELLALNGLPTLAGINSVSAQVIGDAPSNYSQTVEINQGSESGIKVGMPVLNAAGLVGKVTKVFANRAVINDDHNDYTDRTECEHSWIHSWIKRNAIIKSWGECVDLGAVTHDSRVERTRRS